MYGNHRNFQTLENLNNEIYVSGFSYTKWWATFSLILTVYYFSYQNTGRGVE